MSGYDTGMMDQMTPPLVSEFIKSNNKETEIHLFNFINSNYLSHRRHKIQTNNENHKFILK